MFNMKKLPFYQVFSLYIEKLRFLPSYQVFSLYIAIKFHKLNS